MLYYLFQLTEGCHGTFLAKLFHILQYISFRALAAGMTSFLLALFFGKKTILFLTALKVGQPIRSAEEVHRLNELHGKKAGTPTMGGMLLIGSVLIASLLWARISNPLVIIVLIMTASFSFIGFYDDYLKVVLKDSAGMKSRYKFGLQALLTLIITLFFFYYPLLSEQTKEFYLPFFKEPVLKGLGFGSIFFFYLLIIAGSSNAVNITDGLDGLAAGCTLIAAIIYAVFNYVSGNFKIASYLQIPHNPLSGELAVVSMALAGGALGFLWWNAHPAALFMGDTGSLPIGGLLGLLAISCKQEIALIVVGGVFVIETLSVILQVASFKLRGKRIFKMSPLHHHFELSGWKETTVTVRFWIIAIMCGVIGLAMLKMR